MLIDVGLDAGERWLMPIRTGGWINVCVRDETITLGIALKV
jgi:hypothetical protein